MADSWRDEVRVFQSHNLPVALTQQVQRSPAQKHTDEGLDRAEASAIQAADEFGRSLEWATSIGVEIPSRVKGVVTILGQWQKYLEDERKRRG